MKANDLAWESRISERQYHENSARNKLDLVLGFERGRIVGVLAHVNRAILADEEVGVTYGWDYWTAG